MWMVSWGTRAYCTAVLGNCFSCDFIQCRLSACSLPSLAWRHCVCWCCCGLLPWSYLWYHIFSIINCLRDESETYNKQVKLDKRQDTCRAAGEGMKANIWCQMISLEYSGSQFGGSFVPWGTFSNVWRYFDGHGLDHVDHWIMVWHLVDARAAAKHLKMHKTSITQWRIIWLKLSLVLSHRVFENSVMLKSPILLIYSLVKAVLLRIQKKTEITLSVNILSSFSFLLSSLRLRQVFSVLRLSSDPQCLQPPGCQVYMHEPPLLSSSVLFLFNFWY